MKILVIDGQGGRLGRQIIEGLKPYTAEHELIAVGTNALATFAMLKAGAVLAATGENAVCVNAADADLIIGPIGILAADSLLGEVTPRMAYHVGRSRAHQLLIPVNRCNHEIIGVANCTMSELVNQTIQRARQLLQ